MGFREVFEAAGISWFPPASDESLPLVAGRQGVGSVPQPGDSSWVMDLG